MSRNDEPRRAAGGRPRLDEDDETVTLRVRIPLAWKDTLAAQAADAGVDTSTLVRVLLAAYLKVG